MIDDDDGNDADKIYIDKGCGYIWIYLDIFGNIWIYLDGCNSVGGDQISEVNFYRAR